MISGVRTLARSTCWPPPGPAGTFIVARMLCRSLSWMGWVGLAAVLVPLPGLGAGLGLVAEAAAGAEGAGVARAEEAVEDGVTAADWLRELDEELLAGGPPLPSKLARPGPVRAPSPPTAARRHETGRQRGARLLCQRRQTPCTKAGDKQRGVVTAMGPGEGLRAHDCSGRSVPEADSVRSDGFCSVSYAGVKAAAAQIRSKRASAPQPSKMRAHRPHRPHRPRESGAQAGVRSSCPQAPSSASCAPLKQTAGSPLGPLGGGAGGTVTPLRAS